jgi:hypothetical protein
MLERMKVVFMDERLLGVGDGSVMGPAARFDLDTMSRSSRHLP